MDTISKFHSELEKISSRMAEYVRDNGFWFASCPEFLENAEQAVQAGLLVRVEDVLKNDPRIEHEELEERGKALYVPFTVQSALGLCHSVYQHTVLCVPC